MKWNLKQIKVNELKEYSKNPRNLTKKGLEDLEKSIKKFGVAEPLVLNINYDICGGHGRKKILEKLGIKEVDCYLPERELTTKEFEELNIRLNKNIAGEFDFDILANEFEVDDLIEWGFEESELGFGFDSDPNEDDVPEIPKVAISKLGDLFLIDGRHRILCGDSTKKEDVERLMDGKKAGMVFTDPPYGMSLETDYSQIKGSKKSIGFKGNKLGNKYEKMKGDNEDFKPELITSIFLNFDYCKEIFVFGVDYFIDLIPNYGKDGCLLVWNKRSSDEQQKGIGSCFELFWSKQKHKKYVFNFEWFGFLSKDDSQDARNRLAPSMKPIKLIRRIFDWFKIKETLVIDLFLGSGSTLIACEQTNRICYGMEISEIYIDVILKRYKKLYPTAEFKCLNRDFDFEKLFDEDEKQAA